MQFFTRSALVFCRLFFSLFLNSIVGPAVKSGHCKPTGISSTYLTGGNVNVGNSKKFTNCIWLWLQIYVTISPIQFIVATDHSDAKITRWETEQLWSKDSLKTSPANHATQCRKNVSFSFHALFSFNQETESTENLWLFLRHWFRFIRVCNESLIKRQLDEKLGTRHRTSDIFPCCTFDYSSFVYCLLFNALDEVILIIRDKVKEMKYDKTVAMDVWPVRGSVHEEMSNNNGCITIGREKMIH